MFAASKSGQAIASADPYFPYVPLLLGTTSTNGQQNNTFQDSSTNNFSITRGGTATQGSVTPYWPAGYWSVYFSSSYLSVTDSASLRFGASNFTIQAWVFRTASGATHTIAAKGASTPTGWVFQISSADKLVFIDTSTSITGATSLAANTWYYVAVVRAGTGSNQTTLYVNGVSDGTGTSATTFNQTTAMRIGTDRSAANSFAGYISNLRLSNTNLTITSQTSPLSVIGSTIFYSLGYNRFVDGSTLNSAITIGTGAPQSQTFQPFSPTASYTTTLYGGSGYFNGTADYLNNTTNNTALALGSGNFTIEFWMNAPTTASALIIYDNRLNTAVATGGFQIYHQSGTIYVYGGTITDVLLCSASITYSTWTHVAVVRSGSGTGNVKLYLNGVLANTYGSADTNNYSQGYLNIANYRVGGVPSGFYSGYLSNFRIVKGTAVYTGAFTPPTLAPIKTAGSTSAASYSSTTNVDITFAAANTSLLLDFTNAGIYDAAVQNNAVTVADAQASTTQFKWSPTSMKFDGTGDWLTLIDGPQLQLGTGDFTIEGWFYLAANGVAYGLVSKGTASTGWSVNVTSGNRLQFSYTASNLTGATTTLAATTWYYFAVVRSGSATGNLKIYINGTLEATSGGAVTDNFNQTSVLYVGASRTGTTALNGYLQDVRITNGFARTITTPPAAFPTR